MKTIIFFNSLLLSVILASCDQASSVKKSKRDNKPVIVNFYEGTKDTFQIFHVNQEGLKDDFFREYYESGRIKECGLYQNGIKSYEWYSYFDELQDYIYVDEESEDTLVKRVPAPKKYEVFNPKGKSIFSRNYLLTGDFKHQQGDAIILNNIKKRKLDSKDSLFIQLIAINPPNSYNTLQIKLIGDSLTDSTTLKMDAQNNSFYTTKVYKTGQYNHILGILTIKEKWLNGSKGKFVHNLSKDTIKLSIDEIPYVK